MPAFVASRYDPHVHAFYDKLLSKGKLKMQALVAVMRKLLHAIHGMLRTDTDFQGEKFFAMEG
jgi:transposase